MQNRNVFILLGQSNMVGQGDLSEVINISNSRIYSFNNNCWDIAQEPLHKDNQKAGIGLAMSFAETLIKENTIERVDFIPLAIASTQLDEWMPYSRLYNRVLSTIQAADISLNDIKGVLWHHGESETKDILRASSYAYRFEFLIKYLRQDLGNDNLPIIAGEQGHFLDDRFKFAHIVNEQLHSLEQKLNNFKVVSSNEITANDDGIHMSAKSLREFGNRYAKAFLDMK
ncbi:sialate O-acetylesterase [Francisella sp. 19X1-34]|uniref:sialate O-acetylesterase n=1 Tax=Francisella sp. 19X1-34 TaxID=3087177 RepID=UPI002E3105FF|nr:sialate O-acetylesterase [Francisella sp. 19X1-34]MED7789491.1 sialate O-acetylesterase [Francisella sp. 19X1-34]